MADAAATLDRLAAALARRGRGEYAASVRRLARGEDIDGRDGDLLTTTYGLCAANAPHNAAAADSARALRAIAEGRGLVWPAFGDVDDVLAVVLAEPPGHLDSAKDCDECSALGFACGTWVVR